MTVIDIVFYIVLGLLAIVISLGMIDGASAAIRHAKCDAKSQLCELVEDAQRLSSVKFIIIEGIRSEDRQAQLVKLGKSQTMHSRHLTGDAVDVVAIVNGQVSWDFRYYYEIARAIRESAIQQGITIRWGGAWHKSLNKAGTNDMRAFSKQYYNLRVNQGKKPFLDGGHFELYEEK